jgi:hypothetical protein
MCAQRMLRAFASSDTVSSPPLPRDDERQYVFDLGPPTSSGNESPEQIIHRLAYALADVRSKLTPAGGEAHCANPAQMVPVTKADRVARLASRFAQHLEEVKGITGTRGADEFDALSVNAWIALVAEEADGLLTALISDGESHGLEASGSWMDVPLIEVREFEVVHADPAAREADDIHDRKMNS